MENRNIKLSRIQWEMQDYDLESCKIVAEWLNGHIKLYETDFSSISASIEDIGLSKRAYNVLKENGIVSLQELFILVSNRHSIQLLKGAGEAVTAEITQKVLKFENSLIFKSKTLNVLRHH